jgi:D-serine deaminase-like pyridoxal phosphate-dependent protein
MSPTAIDDKATPCLLLDADRMTRNIQTLEAQLARLGVPLRPHVKTCKSIEIARRMMASNSPGITVSTLAEAEYFFDQGIEDQLYAVGIAPGKLDRIAQLYRNGLVLKLILDNSGSARRLGEAAARLNCAFPVVLEIDADGQRGGYRPDDPGMVETAGELTDAGCRVLGVMTHMGAAYDCRGAACLERAAERERLAVVSAAERLRGAGFESPIVSVGSTPTATFARNLDGVTEVRAGTHVFMDLVMAGLGVCTIDDIAISVLTEVIGFRPHAGEWLVDAGWMALSRDRGTASQEVDFGYGVVCDESGQLVDDIIVRATSQEHGILARRGGEAIEPDRFKVGQHLRILPNHACATAAQHDGYWLVGKDLPTTGRFWPRMHGW